MPPPALVTNFEILRTQDYVLITFSTPTGEVANGRMQTQEVQRLALTHPRFLELAAALGQIAANMSASAPPSRPAPPTSPRQEPRAAINQDDEGRTGPEPSDWVVRH